MFGVGSKCLLLAAMLSLTGTVFAQTIGDSYAPLEGYILNQPFGQQVGALDLGRDSNVYESWKVSQQLKIKGTIRLTS